MANRTGQSAILTWLGFGAPGSGSGPPGRDGEAADVESVRIIVTELDRLPPDDARFIAAFAFLLSRVARADLQTSDVETARMEEIVMTHGRLPRAQSMLVVAAAKMQSRLLGGSENYLVAREFDQMATPEKKRALLRCLFEVAAADHDVSV
ncbi:MAG TPA: TerB family tellurite resistance protein, partial [Candidatus Polarisedimenticolia bacterium]|nr:TerB family tellurite resistance protein [Candidatus Polarisedimenticolia bacterium]